MDGVDSALKTLNSAIAKVKAKERKRLSDAAGHVSTHLVLLRLSTISQQISQKLSSFLRESLGVLYIGVPTSTLQLAAAIFESVYHNRILSALGGTPGDQKELWESVLYALLSGVLDFLDIAKTKEAKDVVGDTLFPILCDVCFSLSAPRTGVDLRCTAYNILIDAATSHPANQNKLRDAKVLGGERLGSCIWRTRDYLALEGLLNLFARILPSTNNSLAGRTRRTAFIHSVFKNTASPEAAAIGDEIAHILENVPTSDWEATSAKMIDVLASGSIAYPQPFTVKQVFVYGDSYPSDRIYADDKAFLANVLLEEDLYETLEVAYSTINRISLTRSSGDVAQVAISIRLSPRLGKNIIQPKAENKHNDGIPAATFDIDAQDLTNLTKALESRNLGNLVCADIRCPSVPKLSLAVEPAKLELDSTGRIVESLSQSERIENVSQFYRTDEPSDDIECDGDSDGFIDAVELVTQPINAFPATRSGQQQGCITSGEPSQQASGKVAAKIEGRTRSQVIRDTAFGTEQDDLSDISEPDSPTDKSRMLRRTSTVTSTASLIRGRLSFAPASTGKSAARLIRGRFGNVVLDSEDDSLTAPTPQQLRSVTRTMIREVTLEDIEDPAPSLPFVPLVSATSLAALDAPSTPPSQQAGNVHSDTATELRSGNEKVLRFSDVEIPAPNFNAALSSPPVAPRAILKSAMVNKPLLPGAADNDALLKPSPPHVRTHLPIKSTMAKTNDIFRDLAPPSSSPTPGAKSVKAGLRKKNEAVEQKTTTGKPIKRKALAEKPDDEDILAAAPLVDDATISPRPTKRARTSSVGPPEQVDVKPKLTDGRSRPAARPLRKYRAKKGRTSSPAASPTIGQGRLIDYDALPSPPKASAALATMGSPTPIRDGKKITKEKGTKTQKATKVKIAAKGDPVPPLEKVDKTDKKEVAAKKASAKTRDATNKTKDASTKTIEKPDKEKSDKETKTEKVHKAKQPENATIATEKAKQDDDKDDEPPAPPSRRLPPRPRRAGAGAAKDKVKVKTSDGARPAEKVAVEAEVPSSEPGAPARISRRLATAAAKREKGGDNAKTETNARTDNDQSIQHEFVDKITTEPVVELDVPLLVFCSPQKSKAPRASKTKEMTPPAKSDASARKTRANPSSKKSKQTPWDAVADQRLQQQDNASSEPMQPIAFTDDVVPVDDESADTIIGDVTLVQPPTPELDKPQAVRPTPPLSKARTSVTKKIKPASVQRKLGPPPESSSSRSPVVKAVPPAVAKPAPIAVKFLAPVVKTEVETIDLTVDSPSKPVKRRTSPRLARRPPPALPPAPSIQEVKDAQSADDESNAAQAREYIPKTRERVQPQVVRSVSESTQDDDGRHDGVSHVPQLMPKPGVATASKQLTRRKQEIAAESRGTALKEGPVYHSDPGMQRIVEVLDEIHQVVVRSIENKFEAVRHEARVGRDELLRRAADDLHAIRADSVAHFNQLVDLEAEYATVGRHVIHGTEDWVKVNQEICQELSSAVEVHDRGMLSKKFPATLVPL
ncbi:hypothetical protein C8Q74DRAFT_1265430 [Fomes fomentarius]|nr:hypothetical protein C8Q74DRAFT_1265430 [Fomes fomentarius]